MIINRPRRDDMDPHVEHLKELASLSRVVIEIGVGSFCSTFAILDGLPPDGEMVSVDINNTPTYPELREDGRWRFVHGNSVSADTFTQLPANPDMVFIDSGHTYELTWLELLLADFLKPERIVLHDYLVPLHLDPTCRVKQAVDEFVAFGHYRWEALHESLWGLAVLRRND